ncbi:hypothetical protein V8C26DRAFT_224477 [Trichoderma gracile]
MPNLHVWPEIRAIIYIALMLLPFVCAGQTVYLRFWRQGTKASDCADTAGASAFGVQINHESLIEDRRKRLRNGPRGVDAVLVVVRRW